MTQFYGAFGAQPTNPPQAKVNPCAGLFEWAGRKLAEKVHTTLEQLRVEAALAVRT